MKLVTGVSWHDNAAHTRFPLLPARHKAHKHLWHSTGAWVDSTPLDNICGARNIQLEYLFQ